MPLDTGSTGASSFRPHETALDTQRAIAVDADKYARTGNFRGIEADRSVFEGRHGSLNFAELLIDFFRQVVRAAVLRLQRLVFRPQCLVACGLLRGNFLCFADPSAANPQCGQRENQSLS